MLADWAGSRPLYYYGVVVVVVVLVSKELREKGLPWVPEPQKHSSFMKAD